MKNIVDFRNITSDQWLETTEVLNLVKRLKIADKIILPDGNEIGRIDWKSGYHDVLTYHCQNPHKAKIILDAFNEAFSDVEEGHAKERIRQFILRNQVFIGIKIPRFNLKESSIVDLMNDANKVRFIKFLGKVQSDLSNYYNAQAVAEECNQKAIAILTCNAGGGHRSVANSMQEHLETNHKVVVLNVDEFTTDCLDQVTKGVVKSWQLFSKFRCQENNNKLADAFCDLRWELHQFLPNKSHFELNEKLHQLGVNVILNTIHHEPHWIAPMSDLGVSVAFVNTDYSLPPQLQQLKEAVQSNSLQLCTPISYPDAPEDTTTIGYPLRNGFESDECKASIIEIEDNEDLVVVQGGSLGMGLEAQVKQILKEGQNLIQKTHFVILCGNNESAKERLQSLENNEKVVIHVMGVLDDKQMNSLYRRAKAIVGKPGGATTAEIHATHGYLLAYEPLPWERPNLEFLKRNGLAEEISSQKQLIEFLNKNELPSAENYSPPKDWKTNLDELVSKMMEQEESDEYPEIKKCYSASKIVTIWNNSVRKAMTSIRAVWYFMRYLIQKLENFSPLLWLRRIRTWWKYS